MLVVVCMLRKGETMKLKIAWGLNIVGGLAVTIGAFFINFTNPPPMFVIISMISGAIMLIEGMFIYNSLWDDDDFSFIKTLSIGQGLSIGMGCLFLGIIVRNMPVLLLIPIIILLFFGINKLLFNVLKKGKEKGSEQK